MTVIGIIFGAVLLTASVLLLGPYGAGIFLIIVFGIVFSNYQRTKEIHEDLKEIKEKLGLLREDERIAREIDKALKAEDRLLDSNNDSDINKEIEDELESYWRDKDSTSKK